MLTTLTVKNYALIDELHLQFGKKLNIITGETGAGKSILLGALGLLLGQRADSGALLDKTAKCIVEGEFDSKNKAIEDFFHVNELDIESRILIRREISKEGKS
ncbi:MAG TPA: AAA family ATPase, partial [Bacteroidia bacterium]|nr:AAA family ATPase [Bacteroidia bacterium]